MEEGAYLKSKLWWLGLALIAIGEGGNFLSYGFAPASVVAPLGTVVSLLDLSVLSGSPGQRDEADPEPLFRLWSRIACSRRSSCGKSSTPESS